MTTVFVRTESGVVMQMDVPTISHARERFEQQLTKGELVIVDDDLVEEYTETDRDPRTGNEITHRKWRLKPGAAPDPVAAAPAASPAGTARSKKELLDRAAELGVEVKVSWSRDRLDEVVTAAETVAVAAGDADGITEPAP